MPLTDQQFFDNYLNCAIKYIVDNGDEYSSEKCVLQDDGKGNFSASLSISEWNYPFAQPTNETLQSYELDQVDYQYKLYMARTNKSGLPSLTLVQWESLGTSVADNFICYVIDDSTLRLFNGGSWTIYASSQTLLMPPKLTRSPRFAAGLDIESKAAEFLAEDADMKLEFTQVVSPGEQEPEPDPEPDPEPEMPANSPKLERSARSASPAKKRKEKQQKKSRKNSDSMVEVVPESDTEITVPTPTPTPAPKKKGWWG